MGGVAFIQRWDKRGGAADPRFGESPGIVNLSNTWINTDCMCVIGSNCY